MDRRVAVTGLGIISPVGNDVQTFWESLKSGRNGLSTITLFPVDQLPVKVGGEVHDFDPDFYGIDKQTSRKHDKYSVFALAAASQAVDDSALSTSSDGNIDPSRLGVCIGSGIGGCQVFANAINQMAEDPSGRWVSPMFVPATIANMAGALVSIRYNAQASCVDVSTACATSTHCLGEAYRTIKHGYADAIIAGGSEACIIPAAISGFANMRALSRDPDPETACRPFDADRQGFVMSEGSAVLVLEEYEHALARGAHIYAELVGYGTTCDAYHFTAPRPDGTTQARCISEALKEAAFDPDKDCVYINAHGTGTHLNDAAETLAYKLAFGDFARKCHISSTKSMHGHMFGATGAAEAIATILALRDGIVPPTIHLEHPDPQCDLDYTPLKAVSADLTLGISDSFGFGGHNSCVAFRRPSDK